jgi:hypothetical protein
VELEKIANSANLPDTAQCVVMENEEQEWGIRDVAIGIVGTYG